MLQPEHCTHGCNAGARRGRCVGKPCTPTTIRRSILLVLGPTIGRRPILCRATKSSMNGSCGTSTPGWLVGVGRERPQIGPISRLLRT